ncbi:HAD family hydrolase [Synechococcus sp. UW140]|uniref:HAD family hydrolase n=1 Tax=Synechococcus sp. UW140 TaxID=368503 RepID=UPI0031382D5E
MIDTVLFDFDGVLIDSLPTMSLAWNNLRLKFGIKPLFSEYQKYIGLPFNVILSNLGIPPSLHLEIHTAYSDAAISYSSETRLFPAALYILDWLVTNNYKIALVTSKDLYRTQYLVNYFSLPIIHLITPESTLRGKPSPDPLFHACTVLNSNICNCVFVGDMHSDMLAAKAANCEYLHFLSGYGSSFHLSYGYPLYSLQEIRTFLIYY